MGLFDRIRSRPPAIFTPRVTTTGSWEEWWQEIAGSVSNASPASLFREQPHLRTVVTFLGRNCAQLGLHSFERVSETDRQRDRNSVLARTLAVVDGRTTTYELVFALVVDLCLYDRAYWFVAPSSETASGYMLRRLPPSWVTVEKASVFAAESWRVSVGDRSVVVDRSQILEFPGFSPTNPLSGSPAIEALRTTLQEQIEAAKYRSQVWKRGGRVSAVLQRPAGAPSWSDGARERFRDDWYAKYTGNGAGAGGTPILEDGMTLQRVDFSAKDQEYVDAAKLSLSTVAAAFHVNPTMIGILDNANYSNVREFRRMLYGDTLGPILAQIEARLNAFLLPMLGVDPERFYVEFNIAEKLQGSFEEQASVMSTLVGRPIMSADEGRAKFNLPALGGDAAQLVTPLNVLVGGQASPTDSGSQNERPKARQIKAAPTDAQRSKISGVLASFFARQGKAVLSAIGAGGDWWDGERWDAELADDLTRVTHTLVDLLGKAEADRLGYPDDFNPDRTVEFIKSVATRYAKNVNATTKAQLDDQMASDEPNPAHVFEVARDSRADGVGGVIGTFAAAFASVEAARHIGEAQGLEPTKTWVTGTNPRQTHAAMNGETAPVSEPFSNGLMWPAESGDVDEVAGCNCSVEIDF